MKVQCDACEKAVASVICCADEAALCTSCDSSVHAANKLASKHQRVPLIGSLESPRCDICQDKSAYFFCLEDRSFLCRNCDLSVHLVNAHKSAHRRFLVPGITVGLGALTSCQEPAETLSVEGTSSREDTSRLPLCPPVKSPVGSRSSSSSVTKLPYACPAIRPSHSATDLLNSPRDLSPISSKLMGVTSTSISSSDRIDGSGELASHGFSTPASRGSCLTEFLPESIQSWRVEDVISIPPAFSEYSLGDFSPSKMDSSTFGDEYVSVTSSQTVDKASFGDFDWTADFFSPYANSFHEVPQMRSQPNATGFAVRSVRGSGISKGKEKTESFVPEYDDGFVVPDLDFVSERPMPVLKRRRQQFLQE